METIPPSQDQNIRANQKKDQQDRQNEPQAQTHPHEQPVAGQGRPKKPHNQAELRDASSDRGVNEAQRDQQIVQPQSNQQSDKQGS